MRKKIMGFMLACFMTVSVVVPNEMAYAKNYIVGEDADGNAEYNVQNLTGDALGGDGWKLRLDCAPEEAWTLEIEQKGSWLKLMDGSRTAKSSGTGPRSFQVNLKANNTTKDRSATIIFDCGDRGEEYIYVYQSGSKAAVVSSKNLIASKYKGDGNAIEIEAGTDVQWRLTKTCSWISFDEVSGSGSSAVTPTFKANPSNRQRSATIKLQYKYKGSWKTANSIKVKQNGKSGNY